MFAISKRAPRGTRAQVLAALAAAACGGPPEDDVAITTPTQDVTTTAVNTTTEPPPCAEPLADNPEASLSAAFAPHFRIGTAMPPMVALNEASVEHITAQFNHLSPENMLKWNSVNRNPGEYNFEFADQFVEFGEEHGMSIYGHVLVWHQQVPSWVFQADVNAEEGGAAVSADVLLERLETHITTVAGRYGARVGYWDVVNEAFNDDGSLRDTPWRQILGDDYIAIVFELASRLLPDSKLVYNDFSLVNTSKRAGAIGMIEDLKARGIRIDAVGEQGHYNLTYPSATEVDNMLQDFRALNLEVLITELDVDVLPNAQGIAGADLNESEAYQAKYNPYPECLPIAKDAELSARWGSLFEVLTANSDIIETVTFWGVSDGQSWLNNWPVQGRTNYPLLFNRDLTAKSALKSVLDTANSL